MAQNQLALGLVMIVAFSLGLAATLTVLGHRGGARDAAPDARPRRRRAAHRERVAIVGVGVLLTFQAAGQLT